MGRPTDYSEELGKEICDALENSVRGLQYHCQENKHWPARRTIVRWIREIEPFRLNYEKSKSSQADFMSDEMIDVAYNDKKDHKVIVDDEGNTTTSIQLIQSPLPLLGVNTSA